MDITYAISPNHSGVYWFDTPEGAAAWCRDHDGAIIEPARIDPDIRREAAAALDR